MHRFILRRLGQGALAVVGVTMIVFVSVRMAGDLERFLLPPDAGAKDFARVRAEYGLDRPIYIQYALFLTRR